MTLDMPPPMPKYVTLLPPNVCQITIMCVTLLHPTRYIYIYVTLLTLHTTCTL